MTRRRTYVCLFEEAWMAPDKCRQILTACWRYDAESYSAMEGSHALIEQWMWEPSSPGQPWMPKRPWRLTRHSVETMPDPTDADAIRTAIARHDAVIAASRPDGDTMSGVDEREV